jgi:hypothetical protein
MTRAIAAARTPQLDHLSAELWKAYAAGALSNDDAQAAAEAIRERKLASAPPPGQAPAGPSSRTPCVKPAASTWSRFRSAADGTWPHRALCPLPLPPASPRPSWPRCALSRMRCATMASAPCISTPSPRPEEPDQSRADRQSGMDGLDPDRGQKDDHPGQQVRSTGERPGSWR